MNRVKKYIRSKGHKLEKDFPFMPYGEIDGCGVNSEKVYYWFYHYGIGLVRIYYDRNGNSKEVCEY